MARRKTVGKKRPSLDRERVLRAAIELADNGGIEALSMRRLGHELSVEAMSLYNHVSNKDDVLAGIVDIIIGGIDVTQTATSWTEAMRRRAVSMRRVFTKHPWAVGLLRYCESVLDVLRRAGFSPLMAMRAFSVLDSYAYGYSIQEKSLPSGSAAETRQATELFVRQLPASEYPRLAEVAASIMRSGMDYAKEFELGLDLLLEALERWRGRSDIDGRSDQSAEP